MRLYVVGGRLVAAKARSTVLSRLLRDLVDRRSKGDAGRRSQLINRMSEAAGIERSTVVQILGGGIVCPPKDRLSGFARVLGVSSARLVAAAGRSGCKY